MQSVEERNPEMRDTLQQKERLLSFLGPITGPQYFDVLSGFLTAKRPREELEAFIYQHFPTSAQLHLHNDFILNILHNAHLPEPDYRGANASPSTGGSSGMVTGEDGTKAGADGWGKKGALGGRGANSIGASQHARRDIDAQRKMLKKQVMNLPKAEKDRLKVELRHKKIQRQLRQWPEVEDGAKGSGASGKEDAFTPKWMSSEVTQGVFTPMAQTAKVLPNVEALRHRMAAIAAENGLERGVAPDVAAFLGKALEGHIKTILEHCADKLIEPDRAEGEKDQEGIVVDEKAFGLMADVAPHAFVEPIPGIIRLDVTPARYSTEALRSASRMEMEDILADIIGA